MKCNETQGKWCKNKHGASKIIDTFETYHGSTHITAYPEPPEDTWVLPPWRRSYALEEILSGHAGEVYSIG
jgi:hypothetical protein